MQISTLPQLRALVLVKQPLLGEKGRRVILPTASDDRNRMLLVQHLVIDDPLDEVGRDIRLIERRMNANQAILDRVRAQLEAVMAIGPAVLARQPPPADARINGPAEVARVQAIEELAQIVMLSRLTQR